MLDGRALRYWAGVNFGTLCATDNDSGLSSYYGHSPSKKVRCTVVCDCLVRARCRKRQFRSDLAEPRSIRARQFLLDFFGQSQLPAVLAQQGSKRNPLHLPARPENKSASPAVSSALS